MSKLEKVIAAALDELRINHAFAAPRHNFDFALYDHDPLGSILCSIYQDGERIASGRGNTEAAAYSSALWQLGLNDG